MKKLFFLFFVVLLSCLPEGTVQAQRTDWSRTHELRLGIGCPPIITAFNGGFGKKDVWVRPCYEIEYDGNTYMTPVIGVEYTYNFKRWFAIEAGVFYSTLFQNRYNRFDGSKTGYSHNSTYTVAARAKFTYFSRGLVTMYSSAGFSTNFLVSTSLSRAKEEYYASVEIIPFIDLKLFGLTVGKKLYGFAECGLGGFGLVNAGIGYRF